MERKHKSMVLVSLVITLCVGLFVYVYLVQDSIIFYNVEDTDSLLDVRALADIELIEFTSENETPYTGALYRVPDEDDAPLIIYFGGNVELSYRFVHTIQWGGRSYLEGYNFLYIDYAGYGQNSGQANYQNIYEQALATYDYALTLPGIDSGRIISMGFSLGTGPAVYLAANRPIEGLVLIAPYAEGADFYNAALPIFRGPLKMLVKQKFPSVEYAKDVTCPVLIVASTEDEVVPFSSSVRLSEAFAGDVEFVTDTHHRHNDIILTVDTTRPIRRFLEGLR